MSLKFLSPIIFSQEWIHKITDNLLIKSKADASKGRDNYGRNKLSRQLEQTSAHPVKKEKTLIDENEAIYGIGYLNPAFDDNQCTVINTPETSPIDVPHRSRKSSAKSEKVKARIVDVSRTVRRKLDMSSVPDVVQTSQLQVVQIDDDLPSPCSDTDVHMTDEEEFFLTKNSKLFSQVSSNTLTATDIKTYNIACAQQNPFRIVEVKEMEIVKSVASSENHVILPSANVSVGLMPQVVERVEIIEDTETEAESIDTDTEDREVRGKVSSAEQVVNKKKELVPILKKKKASVKPSAKNIKRLVLKLDLNADKDNVVESNKSTIFPTSELLKNTEEANTVEFSNVECSKVEQQLKERLSKLPVLMKDTESVAEYLILDDNKEIEKSYMKSSDQTDCAKSQNLVTIQIEKNNQKEVVPEKTIEYSRIYENIGNASCSKEEKPYKKSPLLKRTKSLSKDDTLEDCESFYGSDKETDDVLIFSDDTEIDVGSSSSDGEDTNLGKHVEHLLDKVTCVPHISACDVHQPIIYFKF